MTNMYNFGRKRHILIKKYPFVKFFTLREFNLSGFFISLHRLHNAIFLGYSRGGCTPIT